MSQIELISYISQSATFKIFYPKDFILNEDEDGIVTITSPLTYSNLTLSGYHGNIEIDEKVLTEFFEDATEAYIPISPTTKDITTDRLYIEQAFKQDNINWIWWAVAKENQIIMISVNSEDELSEEDYNLYRYMIDQIEIYPAEFED